METWEIISTAVGMAIAGTGFFLGLRYIIQTGFTKTKEDNARLLRGQEYLKEEIQKQEKQFERVEQEVRQNRESFNNVEIKMAGTLDSLAGLMKEQTQTMSDLRLSIIQDHSAQLNALNLIAERLSSLPHK